MSIALLTEAELAEADKIKTAKEHRDYCDRIKAARGGNYPPDWYQKMLVSGKNTEIIRRYSGEPEFQVTTFKTADELLAALRGDAHR